MGAHWTLFDVTGGARSTSQDFEDPAAAESWLASTWAALREDGITSVALIVEDEERYRMSLEDEPADDPGGVAD